MTLFIGVDPGLSGAIAVLDDEGRVHNLQPMPVIKAGRGGRDQYDVPTIRELLLFRRGEQRFVTVERSQALPPKMGGSIANFYRGVACGFAWMLTALDVPFQLVLPQGWQKLMLAGTPGKDTKQKSVLAVQRLFPGLDLRRNGSGRKPDHNLCDALLLAEWGRRQVRPS